MAKQIWKALDDLSPSQIKLRNLPRKPDGLYNLKVNQYGQLVKRAGYSKYNTTSIGAAHKITGLHRFYKQTTSSKEFLCSWNTSLYKIAETTPWGETSIKASLTADSDTFFADFANHCYIVNGADTMMKYNMTNVRTVGITVPAAPTGVSDVDGSLTEGVYYYKYTFVDEDGYESNGGTASAAITALAHPNDGVTLTIAASADAKIAKRRIYRTTVGGSIYYYDGEVADNSTTTYSSTIADSAISLKSVLHTDHNAPPAAPDLVVKRLSRINIAVDDDLYVSKNYDKTTGVRSVEYFPSTNYYPTGNGQKITGLIEQLNGLPVFTEDTVERLVGTDKDNFEYRNAHQEDGCISKRSVVNCKNYVVYLAFNGIYIFDGVSAKAIDIEFRGRLNKYIRDNINYSYAHLSCATYYDNKYLLCIPTGASAVPNVTIYYDFETKSYGVYSFAFSCFCKFDKGGDGLRLFGGSNTIGRIYEIFKSDSLDDDDSAITAYDDIEPLDFGKPEVYKNYYSVLVRVKTTTGTAFRFYYTLDDGTETYASKTLTADKTRWYRISLGSGGKRGRTFKPRPYMSDKFHFEIHGLAICYDEEAFAEEKE